MPIRFDKIDGFIRVHGGEFRYLALFDRGLFDKICYKFERHVSEKSGIPDSINHNFGIDAYNYLAIEEILTFHNIIILIKPVGNKNKNEYYYNIFLQKGLYKDKSDTQDF